MDAESWRFYLDEDVPASAAEIARGLGLDVVATRDEGHLGWADEEQLWWAGARSRVLVTCNRDDYLQLTRSTLAAGKPHAGVLIVVPAIPRQGAAIAHALERLAAARSPLQACEVQFLSAWSGED